jgi:hypothetical protein
MAAKTGSITLTAHIKGPTPTTGGPAPTGAPSISDSDTEAMLGVIRAAWIPGQTQIQITKTHVDQYKGTITTQTTYTLPYGWTVEGMDLAAERAGITKPAVSSALGVTGSSDPGGGHAEPFITLSEVDKYDH